MLDLEASVTSWSSFAREQQSQAAGCISSGLVLFGCGRLGRKLLRIMRNNGIEPACFCDNASKLWGQTLDSLAVVEPAEAARRFGHTHTFIIAIWRPAETSAISSVADQLQRLGARSVLNFVPFLRLFPNESLPCYLWDSVDGIEPALPEIAAALNVMADEQSRAEFVGHLEFRLSAQPGCLPAVSPGAQYFPPFLHPVDRESFVDCGAYDGDTIRDFTAWTGGSFQEIVAFEPDPASREALIHHLDEGGNRDRCSVRSEVVSSHRGVVRFDATGQAAAAISTDGSGIEVQSISLDEVDLRNPTFVKMDIEGAEADALLGARQTIARYRPVVAACAYHRQSDLWQIPLRLNEIYPEARIFLRSHRADGFDSVCYAVPETRIGPT